LKANVDLALYKLESIDRLAGYPEKSNFLFLLQNNAELRPTGGFIGTYGIIETNLGDISRFDTHDIYHIDMPVKDKINVTPPQALVKYLGVDRWYMRDSNWSPSWPESARQAEWFFREENKLLDKPDIVGDFDGVLGITPSLITDLLYLTGPLTIENVTYDKDNFSKLLEYRVEKGYVDLGVSSWERKEVIGDIAEILKKRLLDLPSSQWPGLINVLSRNLASKDILIYLHDESLNNIIKENNFSGEIVQAPLDYLMVVDANMAAYKTDEVISRSINYNLEEKDGNLFVNLKIHYAHQGDFDWRTTKYRTYTRIYVPLGSQLVQVSDLGEEKVSISEDFQKTVFGAFHTIEPGEIGTLQFYYKLPKNLTTKILEKGEYSLYTQKQPGVKNSKLTIDLKLKNKLTSYSPTGFSSDNNKNGDLRWQTEFDSDKNFKASF